MSDKYILEGKKAVRCDDVLAWGKMFQSQDRVVAKTRVNEEVEVSTVFLGLDHSFGESQPMLFETMVFGGEHDQDCERYSTWEEAETGHNEMVTRISANAQ